MDKQTKVLVAILAIFVIGMTMSVAFAEPVSAKSYKYKGKKTVTCKIKDKKRHKTVKVKAHYWKHGKYYLGGKDSGSYSYGVRYFKQSNGKWYSVAFKDTKSGHRLNFGSWTKNKPVTRVTMW